MTTATARLLASDILTADLGRDAGPTPLDTAGRTLGAVLPAPGRSPHNGIKVGLWEAGPGVEEDVENDELFLVLAGSGTVQFDDGSSIALRPGVLVCLNAGDHTTWTITERLRKLYVG